jgi:hypothetical protein
VLSNVSRIENGITEAGFIFIENDSADPTREILMRWGSNKENFNLLDAPGLGNLPIRTLRLEYLRNLCAEYLRGNTTFKNYDYVVVLDMDDSNAFTLNFTNFYTSIDFIGQEKTRAAIFANQIGHYYDMWALRHKVLCPHDPWEEVLDYAVLNNVSDEVAFCETFKKKIFCLEQNLKPIEVDSAFGGLGIYKLAYYLNNPNPYLGSKVKMLKDQNYLQAVRLQICEHVHFNSGIRSQGGLLFINPCLINSVYSAPVYPASAYRSLVFH